MVCFSAVTVLCLLGQYVFLYHALLDGLFQCSHCAVFTGAVCVPVPRTVGWSVSVLSLCCVCRGSMCSCTMHCLMVCFSAVIVLCLKGQYVFLYHALLDGLFQCCHCAVFTGAVCVPVPRTVGWSVSVQSLCCVCRGNMCYCTMHCWMVCFSAVIVLCCRGSMCSCTMHCWMVCFSAVTMLCLQGQYVFLHHALLDGLFQCCHHAVFAGAVCVLAPCTVGWSVSVLSLCSVAGAVCVPVPCTVGWSVSGLSLCCVAGAVCVPVPCTVGWSVSVLSLCCIAGAVCVPVYHALLDGLFQCCHCAALQGQYVFLYHALLDGLFQCCHCAVFTGAVCVPVPCTVGWSVSVLLLCCIYRGSMCTCTMHCWKVCFIAVTVLCLQGQYVFLYRALLDGLFQCCHCAVLQGQYVFLYRALLDGLFQCCHCAIFTGAVCVPVPCTVGWSVSVLSPCCVAGAVCVPVPCTVGWSVSVLSLWCIYRGSMCSCTMHCWMVCFSAVTVLYLQGQYVFLYHALLDGLQTGHLAYAVSQYPVVYKKLCVDDEDATELKKQFQVI